MNSIHVEVVLAAAYALFLIIVAAALELVARHSHHRSERIRVAGFHYDSKLDLWTCPNNEKLLRAEVDYQRRVVTYRAQARACNSCAIKTWCTDSNQGRTIEYAPDSWLQSELRRFHRGISMTLLVLASIILITELFRDNSKVERFFLIAMAGTILTATIRLYLSFSEHNQ